MFRVETFSHPKIFYRSLNDDKTSLHVFKSAALMQYVQLQNSTTINNLTKRLFSRWHDSLTDIYFRSQIREHLKIMQTAEGFQSRQNIQDILLSFRYLVELQITPNASEISDEAVAVVSQIISALQQNEIVTEYELQRNSYTKEQISNQLGTQDLQTIYFYQMDYIDAPIMMLLHWLKRKGFNIVFRIPYHEDFPILHEGWTKLYQMITRTEAASWPAINRTIPPYGERFARYLDKQTIDVQDRDDVSVGVFESVLDFKTFVQENTEVTFTAVHDELLNYYLKAPKQKFDDQNSRFFYFIQFCKKEAGEIYISYDTFTELLQTAWIYDRQVQGSDASGLLMDLKSYMTGVASLTEIRDRLSQLAKLEEVSKVFDQEGAAQAGKNRIKRYLANPFRIYPFLHRTRYKITIKQLIDLCDDLQKKLDYLLLERGERMLVNEYLLRLAKAVHRISEKWDEEEKQKYRRLLLYQVPTSWEAEQPELLQVVYRLMDQEDDMEGVQPLSSIHGLVLVNGKSPLHVTDLSMHSFPEETPRLPKWLSHSLLKQTIQHEDRPSQVKLHALAVDYCSKQAYKKLSIYQLYYILAFHEGELAFSYIKNLHEKDVRNNYLTILAELYCKEQLESFAGNHHIEELMWVEPSWVEDRPDVTVLEDNIPDVYWLDHDFCALKFMFSAIIEQQPIYETDFHQRIAFGSIGSLLSQQSGGKAELEEALYPLFPQWTATLKDNLIDIEYRRELRDYHEFEGLYYPSAIEKLQRLRSVYQENKRTKARNMYRHDAFKSKPVLKQFQDNVNEYEARSEKGNHCKMCPHLKVCLEGVYAVDTITNSR